MDDVNRMALTVPNLPKELDFSWIDDSGIRRVTWSISQAELDLKYEVDFPDLDSSDDYYYARARMARSATQTTTIKSYGPSVMKLEFFVNKQKIRDLFKEVLEHNLNSNDTLRYPIDELDALYSEAPEKIRDKALDYLDQLEETVTYTVNVNETKKEKRKREKLEEEQALKDAERERFEEEQALKDAATAGGCGYGCY